MRAFSVALISLVLTGAAWAQQAGDTLPADQVIPGLMFFTLFAVLAIAIGALVYFLRRRSNREAMKRVIKD